MSELHSLNHAQGLYVINAGAGFTCIGFDVLETRTAGYVVHLEQHGEPRPFGEDAPRATVERFGQYKAALAAVAALFKARAIRCESELTPQLRGKEGKRVEVVDCYGERRRFIVGKSTGFVPIHLEIARRNSSGGGAVTGAPFRSVQVLDR